MSQPTEWSEVEEFGEETEGRYWTARRLFITIIILITLIAFLMYTIAPALMPPAPPPPVTLPRQQV